MMFFEPVHPRCRRRVSMTSRARPGSSLAARGSEHLNEATHETTSEEIKVGYKFAAKVGLLSIWAGVHAGACYFDPTLFGTVLRLGPRRRLHASGRQDHGWRGRRRPLFRHVIEASSATSRPASLDDQDPARP